MVDPFTHVIVYTNHIYVIVILYYGIVLSLLERSLLGLSDCNQVVDSSELDFMLSLSLSLSLSPSLSLTHSQIVLFLLTTSDAVWREAETLPIPGAHQPGASATVPL